MGMEGGNFNRRRFLQAVGVAALTNVVPSALTPHAEAARRKVDRQKETPKDPILTRLRFGEGHYHSVERAPHNDFHTLVPRGLKIMPQKLKFDVPPNISGFLQGADIKGTESERRAGRLERALRFKNISDAVEFRYNLPPGIILSMVMQESHGADMHPNALNDGGIGLAHMQPSVAQEFGLETYKGNARLKDKKHGQELLEQIRSNRFDVFKLAAEDDDRFNRVLNLDAVGRMLATHMAHVSGNLGPLRTAILRYAGRYNYRRYWGQLSKRMSELHNPRYLAEVAAGFNLHNKNLTINGVRAGGSLSPFALYLETFWKENEKGFDLGAYRKLRAYRPAGSDEALRTWRKDLLVTPGRGRGA